MSSSVSVPGRVLDGSVVSLSSIGPELQVNPVPMVLGDETEVDKVNVVLFGSTVTLKIIILENDVTQIYHLPHRSCNNDTGPLINYVTQI